MLLLLRSPTLHGDPNAHGALARGWELISGPTTVGVGASLLALLFIVSGFSKLNDPLPFALGLIGLGATHRLHKGFARWLGLGEVAIAAMLLVRLGGAVPTALAGLVLLTGAGLFLAALTRGKVAHCGCFGASDRPVGTVDVLRNLALGAVAVGLCIRSAQWLTIEHAITETALAASILATFALAQTIRRVTRTVTTLRGRLGSQAHRSQTRV